MAKTTQSAERILQVAAEAGGARINDARKVEMETQFLSVKVPITTDNAALDVIELFELPENAVVFPELSFVLVTDDATSGALTLDIGDATDPDRYADGINAATAGKIEFTSVASTTVPSALHTKYKTTGTTNLVTLTLATFTATIEAGEIIVVIGYKNL